MGALAKMIRHSLKKLESGQETQSPKARSVHGGDRGIQLTSVQTLSEMDMEAKEVMERAMTSEDVLSVVFRHLSPSEGLEPSAIAQIALVCKTWRAASRELPMRARLRAPLDERLSERLLSTEQQIGSLEFCESETAAGGILEHPAFVFRQARKVERLWNVDCLTAPGWHNDFTPYQNLRKLFLKRDQSRVEDSVFDSVSISQLQQLETLCLRGFTQLDLRRVPTSLKMLQVGPGSLIKGCAESPAGAPASSSEDHADGGGGGNLESEKGRMLAFPRGLIISQVVINCGRGAFLDEPLRDYLDVAENITLFGQKLVVKEDGDDPHEALLSRLTASPVRQLALDFDHLMAWRTSYGAQARLSRTGITATQLAREFRASLGGAASAFYLSSLPGSLYEQSLVATRRAA